MTFIWYIGSVYNPNIFIQNTFWKKAKCSSFISNDSWKLQLLKFILKKQIWRIPVDIEIFIHWCDPGDYPRVLWSVSEFRQMNTDHSFWQRLMMISAMKMTVERIRPAAKMTRGKMKCSILRGSSGSSSSSSSLNRSSFISKPASNLIFQKIWSTNTFHLLKPHHMNVELLLKPPPLVDHVWAKLSAWMLLLILAPVPPTQC